MFMLPSLALPGGLKQLGGDQTRILPWLGCVGGIPTHTHAQEQAEILPVSLGIHPYTFRPRSSHTSESLGSGKPYLRESPRRLLPPCFCRSVQHLIEQASRKWK